MTSLSILQALHGFSSRRTLPILGFALILFCAGRSQAADPAFSGTELRDSFPAQGEENTPPELQGGWDYFTEKDGGSSDQQPFIWESPNPERWPAGRLKSGSAWIQHDANYDDALTVVPGSNETNFVLQWTAPVDGSFQIDGWFQKMQKTPDLAEKTDGVELIIRGPDGKELGKFTSGVEDTEIKDFSYKLANVKAGQAVQFVVHADRVNWGNETRLSARISKE